MTIRADDAIEICRLGAEDLGMQVVVIRNEEGVSMGLLLACPGVTPEELHRHLPPPAAGASSAENDPGPVNRKRFAEDLQVTVAERQQLFALFNETV